MGRLALLAVTLGMLAACSTVDNEAERGHAVADHWCAECHRIAPDQPSGSRAGHILPPPVDAPSFMAVAARPGVDAAYLRHFMTELHLPMPTYRLSAAEQESVIAYILSLKTAPGD
jgi:mono/diheme cytochrome c family protein